MLRPKNADCCVVRTSDPAVFLSRLVLRGSTLLVDLHKQNFPIVCWHGVARLQEKDEYGTRGKLVVVSYLWTSERDDSLAVHRPYRRSLVVVSSQPGPPMWFQT